uniref:Uncharacterized protein n=1 Tax=Lepeophtheirus salmonis TaxID=72036 RepID=A0A0K2V5F0_LEPSM
MDEVLVGNICYQLSFDMMGYLCLKRLMDGRTSITSNQGRVVISDFYFVMIQDVSEEEEVSCGEANY